MAYIGRNIEQFSNVEKLDNITFTNSAGPYNLLKSAVAFTPANAQSLLIEVDGVIQSSDSYTVSVSTITFGVSMASTSTMNSIIHLGVGLISIPADGTVNTAQLADNGITPIKFSTSGIASGNVIKVNDAGTAWELGTASSAEVYGFSKNSSGQLIITTTNQGADSISSATYATFDDTLFSASGFVFSISNGDLISTI